MTATARPTATAPAGDRIQAQARLIGGLGFDWLFAGLSVIYAGGLYLDGWAHNHGMVDQSFFTPWHAFFYSGFALTALVLIGTAVVNRRRGATWRTALPPGYGLALLGAAIFAVGGVGDLAWHTLFGIEEDFEALVSPTHLLLGLGLALVVSAPLRAAWRRPGGRGWRELLAALVSLCLLLAALTFFMMFSHPLYSIVGGARHTHFANEVGQVAGITGLLILTALLLGPLFVVLRRWRLPVGTLLLVWGVNLVAMAILDWGLPYHLTLTVAMFVAVAVCDWLLHRAQAMLPEQRGLRIFAFVAPALLFAAYFVALLLTEGSRWSIHLLAGAVVMPGVAGWLLSYVAWPPAGAVE